MVFLPSTILLVRVGVKFKMGRPQDITKLEGARNDIADVYQSQATDDAADNGNLTKLNAALLAINEAILDIKKLG